MARDGHALLALDGDLVDSRSLDGGFGKLDGQLDDVLVDDSLEGVEDLDCVGASHHGDGLTLGSGTGTSV